VAAGLVGLTPAPDGPRWSLFYGHGPGTPWFDAGQVIEEAVFCYSLDYTPELVRWEYEPYDESSIWIVLANLHKGIVVGAIRAIVGELHQLKLDADMRRWWEVDLVEGLMRHGIDPDVGVAECATISVLPSWRRADSHWPLRALCAAFGQLVMDLGGSWCVQLQDVAGPRMLSRQLGLPFDVMAGFEPVDFLGPVIPTVSHVAEHFNSFAHHADEDFIALYAHRDQSVRAGTVLPVIDLTEPSVPKLPVPEEEIEAEVDVEVEGLI